MDARGPDELYPDAETMAVENNLAFLRTCLRQFPVLNLAHRATGRIYARFEHGRLAWRDGPALNAIDDSETLVTLRALAPGLFAGEGTLIHDARYLDAASSITLGRWRDQGA